MEDHNSEASPLQYTDIFITIQTQADHRSELKKNQTNEKPRITKSASSWNRRKFFDLTNQLNRQLLLNQNSGDDDKNYSNLCFI